MTQDIKNYAYGSELIKSLLGDFKVVSFVDREAGNIWISQCLDHDIKDTGGTAIDALANLGKTLEAKRLMLDNDLSSIAKAPQYYYDLWDSEEVIVA